MSIATLAASADGIDCFHCGSPIGAPGRYSIVIDGARRGLCCVGCESAARTILGAGLGAYYGHRTRFAPRETVQRVRAALTTYDRADVQSSFVTTTERGTRDAALVFESLDCPACAWLNESRLRAIEGVRSVRIDPLTRRAWIEWDPARVRLSMLLGAIESIGYAARPYTAASAEALRTTIERRELLRLLVATFAMMQVMMYVVPMYLADAADMTADVERLLRYTALALTLPVVGWAAVPFYRGALRELRTRALGMNTPIALGIGIAFGASVAATVTGRGEVWFDSVTMFVCLLLAARWIDMKLRHRSARAIEDLARLQPATAWRLGASAAGAPPQMEEIAIESLRPGDQVLVRAGAAAPADGTLLDRMAAFDESVLTGESLARTKREGERVLAGTVNRGEAVTLRVDRVGADTWVAAIERMVARAGAARPQAARLADAYAERFVTAILALALVAAVLWWMVDPTRTIGAVVAILIVTCPCALALAAPATLAAASTALARRGILATHPDALERLAQVGAVVFDKTGTLTRGRLALVGVDCAEARAADDWCAIAAALEARATHPVANALREFATSLIADEIDDRASDGVSGRIAGHRYRLGARQFALGEAALPAWAASETADGPSAWLADANGPLARFRFADPLREEAGAVVASLRAEEVDVSILSGDTNRVVQRVATQVGIPDAAGGLTPAAKRDRVAALQGKGRVVAMVGDGLNDSPGLARAEIGIAVAGAAPLAQLTADIVIVRDSLAAIGEALAIARRARTILRQNLAWALAYNLLAVPAAALGFVPPWLAGIGMAASSLVVIANATRAAR